MIVKLLTKHHLQFLSLNGAAEARLSLHMSKCHIVGNLMPRLNLYFQGPLIVCLTEMLRMMDDNNYDSLLVVRRGSELKVSGNY